MTGETNLARLLAAMNPVLRPETFVFATLAGDTDVPRGVEPVLQFREAEGLTLVLTEHQAEALRLRSTFPCRMITLEVRSALDAVGFLAAVAARLARAGIACNPVSGFFHDHLFVPADRADEAARLLRTMSAEARTDRPQTRS